MEINETHLEPRQTNNLNKESESTLYYLFYNESVYSHYARVFLNSKYEIKYFSATKNIILESHFVEANRLYRKKIEFYSISIFGIEKSFFFYNLDSCYKIFMRVRETEREMMLI